MVDVKWIVAEFDGVGGPAALAAAPDGFTAGPTDAGIYRVAYCGKHSSSRYAAWSKIRWGSEIKEEAGKILVKQDGKFKPLSELSPGMTRDMVVNRNFELYGKRELPKTWVFNDFGHMTCYFYKDGNGNGRLDGDERVHSEFFHTTPDDEAASALGKPVSLSESHGCVHVKPNDMDTLIAKGYFRSGNKVVVHRYTETSVPAAWKPLAAGKKPFEVHFFPAAKKLVVIGRKPRGK